MRSCWHDLHPDAQVVTEALVIFDRVGFAHLLHAPSEDMGGLDVLKLANFHRTDGSCLTESLLRLLVGFICALGSVDNECGFDVEPLKVRDPLADAIQVDGALGRWYQNEIRPPDEPV